MPNLSQAAIALLHDAECSEVADDYIVIGNIGVTILLSHRAVADINRQARERIAAEMEGDHQ